MRIVIAPDSLKDCLPSWKVAEAIARGLEEVMPAAILVQVPLADGGQGTIEALLRATSGQRKKVIVTGPLGESLQAVYALLGDQQTAVIEMATASGLERVPPEKRNPWQATTRGTGELLAAALDQGATRLLVGIGGSATNDGGAGMAQALGFRLLDEAGNDLPPGGGFLDRLARIDATGCHPRLREVTVEVACDVTNPLTGPEGASAMYGPQKGANEAMVARLDANLRHFAHVVQRDLHRDVENVPGAGAAGGLGAGLLAFCQARLQSGLELLAQAVGLPEKLMGAQLCFTAEGSLDESSSYGKTAVGVARLCQARGVPCVVLAGAICPGARRALERGVTAYFALAQGPSDLVTALAQAEKSLEETAGQVLRLFHAGQGG